MSLFVCVQSLCRCAYCSNCVDSAAEDDVQYITRDPIGTLGAVATHCTTAQSIPPCVVVS